MLYSLARRFIDDYEPDMGMIPSRHEVWHYSGCVVYVKLNIFQLSYPISKAFRSWASYWKRIFWGERIRRITGKLL